MGQTRDHRDADWFWMNNGIIDHYGAKIGPYGIAVYAILAKCANKHGHATPSVRTMAKILGIGSGSVQGAIAKLIEYGLITRTNRLSEAGDATSNEYTLLAVREPSLGVSQPDTGVSQPDTPRSRNSTSKKDVPQKRTGVSPSDTGVSQPDTRTPPPDTQVYLSQIHGVSQPDTEPDPINKIQSNQDLKTNPPISPQGETHAAMNGVCQDVAQPKQRKFAAEAKALLTYFNTVHTRHFENYDQIRTLLISGVAGDKCKLVIDWFFHHVRVHQPDAYEKFCDNVIPFRPKNFDRNRERAEAWQRTRQTGCAKDNLPYHG